MTDPIIEAAKAVIAQWDTPNWKLERPTAELIERLRAAIAALSLPSQEADPAVVLTGGEELSTDEIKLLVPLLKTKISDDQSKHFNGKLWGHQIVDMAAMRRLVDRLEGKKS